MEVRAQVARRERCGRVLTGSDGGLEKAGARRRALMDASRCLDERKKFGISPSPAELKPER